MSILYKIVSEQHEHAVATNGLVCAHNWAIFIKLCNVVCAKAVYLSIIRALISKNICEPTRYASFEFCRRPKVVNPHLSKNDS